jgi:hypothetical protein
MRVRVRLALPVLAAGALLLAACSSGGSGGSGGGGGGSSSKATTTTRPVAWSMARGASHELPGTYRQGVARSGDGWIFVTNDAIYRTDGAFRQTQAHDHAIPDSLKAQGYNHLGDPDIHDGTIWIPLERDDKTVAEQRTARYDEKTLAFVDSFVVAQHHNSFVAVDDDGVVYSTDFFDDDAIVRYTVDDDGEVKQMAPLRMSKKLEHMQGGDIADGAIWLSTDDDTNGAYRVDLKTGAVTSLGSMGRIAGEGEGIDATDLPTGLLHALIADAAIVPMWLQDLRVAQLQGG